MQIKHKFNCAIADDPVSQQNGEVLPSHWNDDHDAELLAEDISEALGYIPYDDANPAGYVNQAAARSALSALAPLAYNATTGEMRFALEGGLDRRNRVQNGDFQVDQRNAGAIVNGINANRFTIDRWFDQTTNATFAVQRTADAAPNRFFHYRRVIQTPYNPATDSTNFCILTHTIESAELADFLWGTANATPITVQFEVNTTIAGNHGFALQNIASTRRSYVTSFNVPAPNVWTPVTITIPGDTASAIGTGQTSEGISLRFCHGAAAPYSVVPALLNQWINGDFFWSPTLVALCATSGAEFRLRKVKLEIGAVKTPFDLENPTLTAEMVRRYFQRGSMTLNGAFLNNGSGSITVPLRTPMRSAPSIQVTMNVGTFTSVTNVTTDSFTVNGTANNTGQFDFSWTASAEI